MLSTVLSPEEKIRLKQGRRIETRKAVSRGLYITNSCSFTWLATQNLVPMEHRYSG